MVFYYCKFQRYLFLPYYLKLCIFPFFFKGFWLAEVLHCRVLAFIFCSLGGFLVFEDFPVLSLVHFSYCSFYSFLLFLSHQRKYYKEERETERDRELIYLEYWWVNHKLWKSIRVALPSIATTSTRGVITSLTWVSFISNTFSIISCEDKSILTTKHIGTDYWTFWHDWGDHQNVKYWEWLG